MVKTTNPAAPTVMMCDSSGGIVGRNVFIVQDFLPAGGQDYKIHFISVYTTSGKAYERELEILGQNSMDFFGNLFFFFCGSWKKFDQKSIMDQIQ